jgi:hypothetical protein
MFSRIIVHLQMNIKMTIGAIIDHSKGTGYAYPDQIQIIMGKSRTLDRDGTTNTPQ